MRTFLPKILIFFLLFVYFTSISYAACIPTGSVGCTIGTFDSCCDTKAVCVVHSGGRTGGTQCEIPTKTTPPPPKDICEGYDPTDTTHAVQTGICYYSSTNNTLRSCSTITQSDYHSDPNYHYITDEIQRCSPNGGNTYQCCAKNDQSTVQAAAPPPPCVLDKNGKCNQVSTAFGTIKVDPGTIVGTIFGIFLSLSGGVAVYIIITSGYKIMFSKGDPEKLKEGREGITAAIIGLLFIIFSVAILRVIGVNILHIPGLNP